MWACSGNWAGRGFDGGEQIRGDERGEDRRGGGEGGAGGVEFGGGQGGFREAVLVMFLAFTEDMADFVGDDAGEGAAEVVRGEPEGVVADAGGGQQNPAAIGLDEGQDVSIGDVGYAERAGVRQVRGLGMGRAGSGKADHDEAVEGLTVDGVLGAVPEDLEGGYRAGGRFPAEKRRERRRGRGFLS